MATATLRRNPEYRARSIGEEIRHEIYPRLSKRTAHVGLALYWFYVVMTVVILVRHRKRIASTGSES